MVDRIPGGVAICLYRVATTAAPYPGDDLAMTQTTIDTSESAADYIRRVARNLDYEQEGVLDDITSPEGILAFFALWKTYDTDFLEGIHTCIAEGDDAAPLRAFIEQWVTLPERRAWIADLNHYVGLRGEF